MKAPIVIGRDHLDCGSVASPNRETEAMKDGSDAIADWALLNALVNTAAGASWVSFHHGGGVGMGMSLHAGMVVVADGTPEAARRLERVLTSDPGMGVIRHADAGYDEAIDFAREARRARPSPAERVVADGDAPSVGVAEVERVLRLGLDRRPRRARHASLSSTREGDELLRARRRRPARPAPARSIMSTAPPASSHTLPRASSRRTTRRPSTPT